MTILIATTNADKSREIAPLLGGLAWRCIDQNWRADEGPDSLVANALAKASSARAFARKDEAILAEDTGLFVDFLGGAPGPLSARYAGAGVPFERHTAKLLVAMKDKQGPERRASFLTAASLALPDGEIWTFCGRLDGRIAEEPRGNNGFGYDSVFYCPALKKTLAEASAEEKKSVSHRSRAIGGLLAHFKIMIGRYTHET